MKRLTPKRWDLKAELAKNGVFIALVLLIVFFSSVNRNFLSVNNGLNILQQVAELGLIAIPLAMLLIAGVVDLSVGSIASASAVIAGLTMAQTHSLPIGLLAGLGFGLIAGAINGVLVAYLGFNPIVITLGFLSVWGGLAMLLSGGRTIPRADLPEAFRTLGSLAIGPVPFRLILLLVVALLGWYLLARHRVGRAIYAIGGNPRAAHMMGLDVVRTRFGLYVAIGFLSAVAGIMLGAKMQSISPALGVSMEMNALTVVLLGGIAFAGGAGRFGGVIAGLLFYGVLRNGLVFMQASPFLQTVIVGLTLVLAVSLDESIQKIVKRAWARRGRQALAALDAEADNEASELNRPEPTRA